MEIMTINRDMDKDKLKSLSKKNNHFFRLNEKNEIEVLFFSITPHFEEAIEAIKHLKETKDSEWYLAGWRNTFDKFLSSWGDDLESSSQVYQDLVADVFAKPDVTQTFLFTCIKKGSDWGTRTDFHFPSKIKVVYFDKEKQYQARNDYLVLDQQDHLESLGNKIYDEIIALLDSQTTCRITGFPASSCPRKRGVVNIQKIPSDVIFCDVYDFLAYHKTTKKMREIFQMVPLSNPDRNAFLKTIFLALKRNPDIIKGICRDMNGTMVFTTHRCPEIKHYSWRQNFNFPDTIVQPVEEIWDCSDLKALKAAFVYVWAICFLLRDENGNLARSAIISSDNPVLKTNTVTADVTEKKFNQIRYVCFSNNPFEF